MEAVAAAKEKLFQCASRSRPTEGFLKQSPHKVLCSASRVAGKTDPQNLNRYPDPLSKLCVSTRESVYEEISSFSAHWSMMGRKTENEPSARPGPGILGGA